MFSKNVLFPFSEPFPHLHFAKSSTVENLVHGLYPFLLYWGNLLWNAPCLYVLATVKNIFKINWYIGPEGNIEYQRKYHSLTLRLSFLVSSSKYTTTWIFMDQTYIKIERKINDTRTKYDKCHFAWIKESRINNV